MIDCTFGFWGSIFGFFAYGDKLQSFEFLGMFLGYVGIILILFGN